MSARSLVRAVTPLFVVSDLDRSIDFYRQKLGFTVLSVWGDPPCFAMLRRDGFDLMLSLAEDPGQVRPHGLHGTWDVYVSIVDVAAEIAAWEGVGIRPDKGPTDEIYEMREIEIADPDGYRVCFAQDISGESLRSHEVWRAVLDVGAAKLRLVLELSPVAGGLVGRLDSLDQDALNMPLDSVAREGPVLRFEMKAIAATFEGTLDEGGGEISGRWSQRGRVWPLVFKRS